MRDQKNGLLYEFAMFCFKCAAKILRQRPHLNGKEYLKNVPTPVIFTVTHDSYFEVPSLSKVYYSLKPRPRFLIMAKDEFLSKQYLSTNFPSVNPVIKKIFQLLDRTGLPHALFRKLRLVTIHRPFIEQYTKEKETVHQEIGQQLDNIGDSVSQGFSTLIFPEGTTWGYGGLKKIRSGIYQLVSNTYETYRKRMYILPINVKVDRCIKGAKDVFINIGKPGFLMAQRDEFISRLDSILRSLHTITFSQIASYYLKELAESTEKTISISKNEFYHKMDDIISHCLNSNAREFLPRIDQRLARRRYMLRKIRGFLRFCVSKDFLIEKKPRKGNAMFVINTEKLLGTYNRKTYRKMNPVGYSANELISLGEETLAYLFDMPRKESPHAVLSR